MGKAGMRTFRRAGIAAAALTAGFVFLGADDSELYLRIHRSIELFSKVYKEITLHHVDEIKPEQLMRAGIDGMLGGVDPYTVFMDEDETDEIDLVTTGRYGGIGVSIGLRDGEIMIVNLLEGYSAARQGLQVGDKIIAVDGRAIHGLDFEEIRRLVRGAPGTEVRFTIERGGETARLEYVLVREDIPVRNIPYAGFVRPGIAYVRIERFSRTAASDLRTRLEDLQKSAEVRGVLLDLRDNPGGLLDIAVDIVAQFVPESSLVVSTRGRTPETERRYYSLERPVLPTVPLAVLVNGNSASASEIVAGAVQDLDRGVILGTRTFGKGLVQTVSRLTENASMKITTARYYTPSGRCIQELDYTNRKKNGDARALPDSLRKEFMTVGGRVVYEAGGITPDTIVDQVDLGPLMAALQRKAMFFKFANQLAARKQLTPTFLVTDKTVDEFKAYLSDVAFDFDEGTERELEHVEERAKASRYSGTFLSLVADVRSSIKKEKELAFDRYRKEIRRAISEEVAVRVEGEQAGIRASLEHDPQVQYAAGLLKDRAAYGRVLLH